MKEKIKTWWKQFRCKHYRADLKRWHTVHTPDYEPASVEVEYICTDCGKVTYIYLKGREKGEWIKCMGDHKRCQ